MKLHEALFDYRHSPFFLTKTVGKNYPIFINPNSKELSEFKGEYRFLANAKTKDFYIFSVYILHALAASEIFGKETNLYKMPHMLLGTISKNKIEDIVQSGENASEVFSKSYYKKFKTYDWQWLKKYFDVSELKTELRKI